MESIDVDIVDVNGKMFFLELCISFDNWNSGVENEVVIC